MGRKRIKQYLMLLLAIGVVAVVASGSGTFASFQAEVTNPNNTFATGTLFLHDTHNGTTCTSESSTDNLTPSGCATLFTVANLAPGSITPADLTLTNAGSVDSADIQFKRPAACSDSAASIGTLNQSETDTSTTLHIYGLSQTVTDNTLITLTDGASNETYKVTTTTPSAGATSVTSVPVTPVSGTGAHTYAVATTVVTFSVGFSSTPALCSELTLYIDEWDTTNNVSLGCVYPVSTPGTACASGTALGSLPSTLTSLGLSLNAGASRDLRISVVAPSSLANSDMSTQASFGLLWHIEH